MRVVFADTGYWIALFDAKDSLHTKAAHLLRSGGFSHIFTSELVLIELMNYYSRSKAYEKQNLAIFIDNLESNPMISIVKTGERLYDSSKALYYKVLDKEWSFVDCASFEIMRGKRISEALAYDHHFVQAGFNVLLR